MKLAVYLRLDPTATGTAWFDDVKLVPADQAPSLHWIRPDDAYFFVFDQTPSVKLRVEIPGSFTAGPATLNHRVHGVTDPTFDREFEKQVTLTPGQTFELPVTGLNAYGVYQADAWIEMDELVLLQSVYRWAVIPHVPDDRHWSRLGFNIHVSESPRGREMKALGVRWARVDWQWILIAPNGPDHFHWDYLDRQVRYAREHGLKLLPVLNTAAVPDWATHPTHTKPFFDIDKFNAFALAILDRYGDDLPAVHLYNEPDFGLAQHHGAEEGAGGTLGKTFETKPELDAAWHAFLADYLHRTSRVIREKHPHLIIVGPGFPANPTNPGGWEKLLSAPHSIGDALDAYSWHNYPAPRSGAPDLEGTGVIGMRHFLERARPLIRGGQIWVTEQGYMDLDNTQPPYNDRERFTWAWPLGVSEIEQGNYLVRLFLLEWAEGLDRAFLFHLNWDTAEVGFYGIAGTERFNGPKPAFVQLVAMGHFLMGANFVNRHDLGVADTHALEFRGDRSVLVLWSAKGNKSVQIPPGWTGATRHDGYGNDQGPQNEQQMILTGQPVYLVRQDATAD